MKKLLLTLTVFILFLTSCTGNVSHVTVTKVDSQIYSRSEIDSAIKVTKQYFKQYFDGCTLTSIKYAGDECCEEFEEWAKQYEADEAILLISDFDVGLSGGDGSLAQNSTYTDWKWILVRDGNGSWRHADHGYG